MRRLTPLHLVNLRVWRRFLQKQHRTRLEYTLGELPLHRYELWTDSSTWGLGAYFENGKWISQSWETGPRRITRLMVNIAEEPGITINALEFAAVLVPLYFLTEGARHAGIGTVRDRFVKIYCDNKATIFWIKKSSARSPLPHVLSLIFEGLAFSYGLRFQIEFVPSAQNVVADNLSRDKVCSMLNSDNRLHIPWGWLSAKLVEPSSVWRL